MKYFILPFIVVLFGVNIFGQFSISFRGSEGYNKSKYAIYKSENDLSNFGVGIKYSFSKYLSIGSELNLLSFDYQIDATATHLKQGGKKIRTGILSNWLYSKFESVNINLRYKLYGFFVEYSNGIGVSSSSVEWKYYFTDYDKLMTEQYFEDVYKKILTYDISFKLGYSYTFKKIVSIGVYWSRVKYFGRSRMFDRRDGQYKPFEIFSPDALSLDALDVNPNCHVWGFALEYHFPLRK